MNYSFAKDLVGIPYIQAKLTFQLKTSHDMELLHLFFIKALLKNASIKEIAIAINFSENEVREEFYKMCNQGYIETDYKTLTKFSYDYLENLDFIETLNNDKHIVFINLLDGKLKKTIIPFEKDYIERQPPKITISKRNVLNEFNSSYFSSNVFNNYNKSQSFLEKIKNIISWKYDFNGKELYSNKEIVYECMDI